MDSVAVDHRRALSEEIKTKTTEIQAVIERIHVVRFDQSRETQDITRSLKNLAQELRRLEADLKSLKQRQLRDLEAALDFEHVGLPHNFLTEARSPLNKSDSGLTSGQLSPRVDLEDEDLLTEEELQNLKLMRTESTGTLAGKTPKHKWQSLFKMFQEWKHETNIAQGQYAVSAAGTSNDAIEVEITKIRAAILSLQRKKTLPPSEQELLSQLQARLQHLLKAKKALANA